LTVGTAAVKRSNGTATKAKIQWPWFIVLFVLAAVLATFATAAAPVYGVLYSAGKVGLTATLFLIGCGVSRSTLRHVGARPLIQGVLLWIVVAVTSVVLIRAGFIAI
jgi:uncharacterized membrane protein YadS